MSSVTIKDPRDIIIAPVVSEKTYGLMDEGKYTFLVDPRSNKTEIKYAIESIFGVKVDKVKWVTMPDMQTAVSALAAGEIDYIEMMQVDLIPILEAEEGVTVEAGVLPLAIRAGAGSVRDTLSVLDQLIAGASDAGVTYERAVALLGYTHAALLDDGI